MSHRSHLVVLAGALAVMLAAPASAGAVLVFAKGQAQPAVWIAADDGSGARRLTAGTSPHVSPDGRTVVFTPDAGDANPELRAIPAAGGEARRLLRPWRSTLFAWSPDGRYIATLTGPETGPEQLVLIDLRDGGTRTVATGTFSKASFAPASDRLIYSRYRGSDAARARSDLYVVGTAGGAAPARLTTDGRSAFPLWGPSQIAFSRLTFTRRRDDTAKLNLWLLSPDRQQRRGLTRVRPPRFLAGLTPTSWSADGSRLLAQYSGQDTSWLATVDPASGRWRSIGPRGAGTTGYEGIKLSRDGGTILAVRGGSPDIRRSDVIAVPYDGGSPRVLAAGAYDADWTR